jgi:hypothetical protein
MCLEVRRRTVAPPDNREAISKRCAAAEARHVDCKACLGMKPSMKSRAAMVFAAGALFATFATGCARTIQFTVTRPAMLNLQPEGGTVTVGDIASNGHPDAAADVAYELRARIANSLNPSIRLRGDGGAVVVDGNVLANTYKEHTETVSSTCSRTVDDGVDANGTPQWHIESYDCSYDVRVGEGATKIQLRVLSPATNKVIFAHTYDAANTVRDASADDVVALMHGLRADTVKEFAKVILPYQEVVTEKFKDCDGDKRCKQGFEKVKAGDYPSADALFTAAIGPYTVGAVPKDKLKQVGEAFYDRGVIRAYQQRYDEAQDDLARGARERADDGQGAAGPARAGRSSVKARPHLRPRRRRFGL